MDKNKTKLIIEIALFIGAFCLITFLYYFTGNESIDESDASEVGIIKITDENFETEVLNSDKPVILEFYSNLCPPCLIMVPTLINIAKNNENIKVATVNDSDDNTKEITKKYEIEATPTIIIFKNGEVHKTFIGATSEEAIMNELKGE